MSTGEFIISKYASNELNEVMPVRVQPETLLLFINGTVNAPPTTDIGLPLFAQVGKNRSAYGVGPRSVTVKWTGTPPDGYKAGEALKIPVMTTTAYAQYTPGSLGNYLGSQVQVISRTPENVR